MANQDENITHEIGDLSEYDSAVDGGGNLSVESGAALANTNYGLQCVVSGETSIYGQYDYTFDDNGVIRARYYIDPNGMTIGSGDSFQPFRLMDGYGSRIIFRLTHDGSNFKVYNMVQYDGALWYYTDEVTITDAPHYVEIRVKWATSAIAEDGIITLFVDGTQEYEKTDCDIYTTTKPNRMRVGYESGDTGTSGTFFVDEMKWRNYDTLIGPVDKLWVNGGIIQECVIDGEIQVLDLF